MNVTKSTWILSFIITFFVIVSCKNEDFQIYKNGAQVKFIEQICCGNLKTLNNVLINSPCEQYKDSLLNPINFNDFPVFQSIQIDDIISIVYEITENCEASCDIICNRRNGIPIKLISVEN